MSKQTSRTWTATYAETPRPVGKAAPDLTGDFVVLYRPDPAFTSCLLRDNSGAYRDRPAWPKQLPDTIGSAQVQVTTSPFVHRKRRVHFMLASGQPGGGPIDALAIILRSLDEEPVEDGETNSAEDPYRLATNEHGAAFRVAVDEWLASEQYASSAVAQLVKLTARFMPFSESWRAELVRLCLASQSVHVRDAAVQAVDAWQDLQALAVLKRHREPVR